jgi:hypothetical protein
LRSEVSASITRWNEPVVKWTSQGEVLHDFPSRKDPQHLEQIGRAAISWGGWRSDNREAFPALRRAAPFASAALTLG